MGPIGVAKQLAPFLPGSPVVKMGGEKAVGAVSAAPWGSASILPISMMYIDMMGGEGTYLRDEDRHPQRELHRRASGGALSGALQGREMAAWRTSASWTPRSLKGSAGIEVEDITKRLMDYGFHAPTVSFPVAGTLMIEADGRVNRRESSTASATR